MTYSRNVSEPTKARLTGLSFSPSNVFTAHDTLKIGFTLENISGRRLIDYQMRLGYQQKDKFVPLLDIGTGAANMPNRAVKSFQHTVAVEGDAVQALATAMKKKGDRMRDGFVVALTVVDSARETHEELFPADCAFFDMRCVPAIDAGFIIRRCDESGNIDVNGERLAMTARISETEAPADGLFCCRLYYAQGHVPSDDDACLDLSDCLAALHDGVENDTTMIPEAFDRAYDWFFKLVYGDGCEAAEAVFILPQSFTNIHEAGYASGGVRFGGFSRSRDNAPLFEADYPALFYAGIDNIQAGVIPAVGMTGSSNCVDIPVRFAKPYAEGTAPVVVAGFQSASTAGPFGRCCVAVLEDSVTNEGFTLRFYNGDAAGRNPAFTYIAVGTPAPAV